MKTPVNLIDFTERVNLYLDNEMDPDDEKNLMKEMDENPSYKTVMDDEREFRQFIKNKVQRSSVSPDLIKTIKEKIRVV